MNNVGSTVQDMINSSVTVMTQPSVATFERFEKRGGMQQAVIYMGIAAVIAGLLGIFTGGLGGLIRGVLSTLLGFLVFTYLVHMIGQRQGGTGSLDEVAYSFALFSAPLQVIGAIVGVVALVPFLGWIVGLFVGLALLVAEVYFAYLAVQSSMNLPTKRQIWITLISAAVIQFLIVLVIGSFGR